MTNRQAIWALGGMVVGAVTFIAANIFGLSYAIIQPSPLAIAMLIGGVVGLLAAKAMRVK